MSDNHVATGHTTRTLVLLLVISCTVLGLAGTDLVLPAVPGLPDVLGGSVGQSQLVLAAFVAGGGLGLLVFGALGARLDQRDLLIASMLAYALVSFAASRAGTLSQLIILRFVQGVVSSAAAVFAPGMIRVMFSERGAIRAIGALSSIESLTPALAPVLGVWLLHTFGWQASFNVLALFAAFAAAALLIVRQRIPNVHPPRSGAGFLPLLANGVFMRYALSQALTLGALLVFVFGAPAVITKTMGGTLGDFIVMQVSGITTFIIAANIAELLVDRFGAERMIMSGSLVSLAGIVAITVYAFAGGGQPWMLVPLFIPMNFGLGLRGPPGFFRAILAADGDDGRGSALVILFVLLIAALGTAAVAPFILAGLVPLALTSAALSALSVVVLLLLPAADR